MKVEKDWWKHFFNKVYLITDARSICDNGLTRRETDLLERALHLGKHDSILDFCGGHGRHSLELARRGYRDLTVLDFSKYLVRMGKKSAQKEGANIHFVLSDARKSGLKKGYYSAIFMMSNSFGYFLDEKENLKILKESRRLLKKGGRLLLDLADPNGVKNNLTPTTWHEADNDIIVCRKREPQGSVIKAREIVISKKKGLLRDGYYCERLYDKKKIIRLLKSLGFNKVNAKNNIFFHKEKKDYGFLTSRMIVTAAKPEG